MNAQPRRFKLLVWGQFALAGVITVAVIVVPIFYTPGSDPGSLISNALPWLVMTAASYAIAIVMLKRNLPGAFTALIVAVLLASGAYPWLGDGNPDSLNRPANLSGR